MNAWIDSRRFLAERSHHGLFDESLHRTKSPLRGGSSQFTYFVSRRVSRMAKSMTKSQIADHVAQKAGLTKKAAVQLLDDFAALAYREAKNVFVVPGIGKLVLANRKARMGRNPQTGEAIKIPAKRVVKFRVSKAAKDAILGKR